MGVLAQVRLSKPLVSSSHAESRRRESARAFNESIAVAHTRLDRRDETELYACECGDSTCWYGVYLTHLEYERVRAHASHFLLARDHENPETEVVIWESPCWAIVELVGREPIMAARRSDPRRL